MPEKQIGVDGNEEPFTLSQKFVDTPDIQPLKIYTYYEEAVDSRQGL